MPIKNWNRVQLERNLLFWVVLCRFDSACKWGFNQPTGEGITERCDRISLSRPGDPGVFEANRASLMQRGQLTVRAQFHRTPVKLSPPQMEERE